MRAYLFGSHIQLTIIHILQKRKLSLKEFHSVAEIAQVAMDAPQLSI